MIHLRDRRGGKRLAFFAILKARLDKGLTCTIATTNPSRTSSAFKYITGEKLYLNPIDGSENLYTASLNNS